MISSFTELVGFPTAPACFSVSCTPGIQMCAERKLPLCSLLRCDNWTHASAPVLNLIKQLNLTAWERQIINIATGARARWNNALQAREREQERKRRCYWIWCAQERKLWHSCMASSIGMRFELWTTTVVAKQLLPPHVLYGVKKLGRRLPYAACARLARHRDFKAFKSLPTLCRTHETLHRKLFNFHCSATLASANRKHTQ